MGPKAPKSFPLKSCDVYEANKKNWADRPKIGHEFNPFGVTAELNLGRTFNHDFRIINISSESCLSILNTKFQQKKLAQLWTSDQRDWVYTLETYTETFSSLVSSSRLRLKFLESRDRDFDETFFWLF